MTEDTRATRFLPALLGMALLVVGACSDAPEHEPEAAGTVVAELAVAERLEIPQTLELFGTVEAERTAAISTRVMAMVTGVHVQAGSRVLRGERLLDIDPQAAQGQLAQASGGLAQARAALALAARNHERFAALAETGAASELELDMARMQHDQARGAVEQAEGAVAAAASVAADSRVVAPFAGRVVRRGVEVGDLATPGRPLLMLESEGGRRLAVRVPESAMARAPIGVGEVLATSLDSRPELGVLSAEVVEVSPGADPMSHSFEVKIELPGGDVPSGATGRVRIEVARRAVVAVPSNAVIERGGVAMVVVRGEGGVARSRVVTIGETLADGRVEVLSGLSGGESVALGLTTAPAAGALLESGPS